MQMHRYEIRDPLDLYGARRGLVDYGTKLQFPRPDCQELAIVVTELISNIIKYGKRGVIRYDRVDTPEHGMGIFVVASDEGPPFHDLSLALKDGWNDRGPIDPVTLLNRGGLGTGMGAIVRFTDSFEVMQHAAGKEIRVIRYRKRPRAAKVPRVL
ncbi:MAG TPA: ATP-binding protein [Polyangiales bacterium]|nr:ATP-binding protein [Polyangiales bacterium]